MKYDYVPKYCTNYRIQGHSKKWYYIIYPESYPKKDKEEDEEEEKEKERKGEKI